MTWSAASATLAQLAASSPATLAAPDAAPSAATWTAPSAGHRGASRRRWLGQTGATLAAASCTALLPLAGCGFALRQTPALPFTRLQLAGFADRSALGSELRARLQEAGVQLLPQPAQAEAVLQVLDDQRGRRVVASTAVGQVRELQLQLRFAFSLATPGGRELIAPTELLLTRDMSYSESFALAKAQEETELFAAMQTDIVQQVLRRLASAPLRG